MLWKILLAQCLVLLVGLELVGRVMLPGAEYGLPVLARQASSVWVPLSDYLIALGVVVAVVGVGLYASLAYPLRRLVTGIRRVYPGRVDAELPYRGRVGTLGTLSDTVAELVQRKQRELDAAIDANQQAKRHLKELELQVRAQTGEMEELRAPNASLERVDVNSELPNRAAFDARLESELLRLRRNGNPLTLALFQVAQLALLNSRIGSAQTKVVMKSVGQVISRSIRTTDYTARYSDDSFVLMLPETPALTAITVVEDIHRLLSETDYELPAGMGPLKVAAGLASTDARPDALDSMPKRLAQAVSRSLEKDGRRVEAA